MMVRNDSFDRGSRLLSLHYDVTSTMTDGLKPFPSRIVHASRPERTRGLPNRDLEARHVDFRLHSPPNFLIAGRFEKELDRHFEIPASFFNGVTLMCNVQFRAQ
jgi:hypothetical protein